MATTGHNNLNAKLVLLGDMGAGKSSLVLRFVKGQFQEFQESTIGAAFFSQTLAVNDATVKFEIWDTAGQERYHSLAPMYYRGAAAAIIVYDITSADSFQRAKKWVQELQKQGNLNMVMAFAGNKADLEEKRKVTAEVLVATHLDVELTRVYNFIFNSVKHGDWPFGLHEETNESFNTTHTLMETHTMMKIDSAANPETKNVDTTPPPQ